MEYNIKKVQNANVIELKGSLLADVQSKEILDEVTNLIQENQPNFVVDLSELKFINSSGLGMLLTCLTKARKAGGDVVLAAIPEQVSNLLVITKLNAIFSHAGTVMEGLDQFNG